jgi:hypothetical protein
MIGVPFFALLEHAFNECRRHRGELRSLFGRRAQLVGQVNCVTGVGAFRRPLL